MNNNEEDVEPSEICPDCGSEDTQWIEPSNQLYDITTNWYYTWFLGHFVCNECDITWVCEEDC